MDEIKRKEESKKELRIKWKNGKIKNKMGKKEENGLNQQIIFRFVNNPFLINIDQKIN